MKFTPFILFLILILVLILSIVFSRFFPIWESEKEGMIDYNNSVTSLNQVKILPYSSSKQVTKLYDNIFFDTGNSNVLIVDGKMTGNVSGNVASLDNITVLKPSGDTVSSTYVNGNISLNSELSSGKYPGSSAWWSYTTDTKYNSDKYQLFYFAWDKVRFIHLMKKSEGLENQSPVTLTNLGSYYFNNNGDSKELSDYSARTDVTISTSSISSHSNDSMSVLVNDYDISNNVYQINARLFFDVRNGNLIIKSGGTTKVYKRDGTEMTITSSTKVGKSIPTTNSFTSWIKNNEISGGNLVLYMAMAEKTLVAIIKLEGSGKINIEKVVSFNKNGVDTRSSWVPEDEDDNEGKTDGTEDYNSEYKKWLAYWNSIVNSDSKYSEDYILKSQVVPPVCPKCPSCPSSGICTNCGGKGGSGTLGENGSTTAGGSNLTISGPGGYATTANPETLGGATTIQTLGVVKGTENIAKIAAGSVGNVVDTTGDIIKGAGTGTVDLLKSTGSGASNLISSGASGVAGLAKETVGGAAGLAKETIGGTVGLAKETIGGTVGLVKDTLGGAVGLAKSAGSGVANVFTKNTGGGQSSQGSAYGVYNPQTGQTTSSPVQYGQQTGSLGNTKSPIDPYSYNGALVSKPSNFIPVTADFSAFSK
jgi:hypothetical protein